MSETPKLTLPAPPKGVKNSSGSFSFGIVLIILLQCGILALLLVPQKKLTKASAKNDQAQLLKDTALKLEELGLARRSAQLWQKYLSTTHDAPKAPLYFRIGKLYQEEAEYQKAIDFFHRAELAGAEPKLRSELGERISKSLAAMKRFEAMGEALRERTELNPQKQKNSQVVAKIGSMEISTHKLDQIIENQIATQMALWNTVIPGQAAQFAGQLEKQYKTPKGKKQALEEYLTQEVLWRKAIEGKLHKSKGHLRKTEAIRKKMLAQEVMQRELSSQAVIFKEEVELYYQAHKNEYKDPAKAILWIASLKDKQKAFGMLGQLKTEEAFKVLLGKNPTPVELVKGSDEISGFGKIKGLEQKPFAKTGLIVDIFAHKNEFLLIWVKEIAKERTKTLEEMKPMVQQIIQRQKAQKAMQQFITSLFEQHKVEIYSKFFASQKEPAKEEKLKKK